MTKEEIYIVGAGTYGEVMYELAELLNYTVKGYYDENEDLNGKTVMGANVLGKLTELNDNDFQNKKFIVAIGNNAVRYDLMLKINKLGGETPTLIHPSAIISPSAQIGKGVYIQANCCIWTKVEINDFSIISPSVVVAHHSKIGIACLISTNAAVGASISIKDKVFLGMGTTIVTGVNVIGENSVVGAGAVVLKNIEKNSVYAGIPAKKIRGIKD